MKTISKSVKTFIRREKARIRKQFFDAGKQEEAINKMYENLKIEKLQK